MSGRGKGGKGLGKGGAKRHPSYPSFSSTGWCKTYLWSYL
ncbi:unnamed protein product [Enterobius vermicularis]|uniref:Myelin basic protein n=1 Tax=Enterobius vermicularis TaxID=51028 RepID=A0A0N4VMT6_ENTVE|nr:unnamed protein product [Enterobius vermicularis]